MVSLTPRHTYNASLGLVLRALAHMRAGGALLHAAEWRMYSQALQADCICDRMAVAAAVAGDSEEVSPPALHLCHVMCSALCCFWAGCKAASVLAWLSLLLLL